MRPGTSWLCVALRNHPDVRSDRRITLLDAQRDLCLTHLTRASDDRVRRAVDTSLIKVPVNRRTPLHARIADTHARLLTAYDGFLNSVGRPYGPFTAVKVTLTNTAPADAATLFELTRLPIR